MLTEVFRELLILLRDGIVLLQSNMSIAIPVIIGASIITTFYTCEGKVNKAKAGSTIGTTTLGGLTTTGAVVTNVMNENNLEEKYGQQRAAYESTKIWVDSLPDEQLARMCELIDGRIQEETQKENSTTSIAEQPKKMVMTRDNERKTM